MSAATVHETRPHHNSPEAVDRHALPHIVLVVPRGEAARNFVYSDTLPELHRRARVTLLSVVDDAPFRERWGKYAEEILTLEHYPESRIVAWLRSLTENAHDRWLWSKVAQNNWELRARRARGLRARAQRAFVVAAARVFANNPSLHALTRAEQYLHWRLRPTRAFDELFARIRPDLVFNCSHIHGIAGELPLRVAKRMGITTAGFIFSWDNLTSRSRIFVPYDHYLVWHEFMRDQLLSIYPKVRSRQVHVTGTPQFDFHFKREFVLPREELCRRIGVDPARPFILYTTGIDRHFFEEHRHVRTVIELLREIDITPRPQLVVRNYVKGTSPELREMASRAWEDVVFPKVLWDARWATPLYEDLEMYTSMIHHAAMSINAASTVTLEFLMLDKPVINLDFDPPGSNLPYCLGFRRHIDFDHYRPVADSGAVMVARSIDDMRRMLIRGLTQPEADSERRRTFIRSMFGDTLDGRSGLRVAETLVALATGTPPVAASSTRSRTSGRPMLQMPMDA